MKTNRKFSSQIIGYNFCNTEFLSYLLVKSVCISAFSSLQLEMIYRLLLLLVLLLLISIFV